MLLHHRCFCSASVTIKRNSAKMVFGLFYGTERGAFFDPVRDIPDLSGKVILVTGGRSRTTQSIVISLAE